MQGRELRRHFSPISHVVFDAMHICFTSGGVFQYGTNEIIRFVLASGIRIGELDDFYELQTAAAGRKHRQRLQFFTSHYNDTKNSHLKWFATDTIAALQVLL